MTQPPPWQPSVPSFGWVTPILRHLSWLALLVPLIATQATSQDRASNRLPLLSQAQSKAPDGDNCCPPLEPPSGPHVTVTNVTELVNAVNTVSSGTTILVADGNYPLNGAYLRFDVPWVSLRSESGNRDAVILDGNYQTTEIIQIAASNITIADLTLREAYYHPIHVMSTDASDTLGTLIYNVHIIDPGEQAIKINPYTGSNALYFPDEGTIACCHIELTDAGRPYIRNNCYTGGVDAHQARDWIIRDNLIEGFWCDEGLSEHGIHFWRSCRDPIVERNMLRNNARGIGFGLVTSGDGIRTYADDPCPAAGGGYVDHYGGVIRNNMVFVNRAALFSSEYGFDCGICLWNACDIQTLHNTVVSTQAPFSSIEWLFDFTDVDLINNLVSHNLVDRGGTSVLAGNLENAPGNWFVDAIAGDLHLTEQATDAIDQGAATLLCPDDFDGDARPVGAAADIGADEVLGSCALADVDSDGDVDTSDISEWTPHWSCYFGSACFDPPSDTHQDQIVNIIDGVFIISCMAP